MVSLSLRGWERDKEGRMSNWVRQVKVKKDQRQTVKYECETAIDPEGNGL